MAAFSRPGRWDAALATLDRAARLDPTNPSVPLYRGTVLLQAGRPADAARAYQEALAIDPRVVAAHVSLAMMASDAGRASEAVGHWERAIALDPSVAERLLGMATALWSAGRRDQARPLLELFVERAPGDTYGERIAEAQRLLAGASNR